MLMDISEHDLMVMVVWALVVSSFVQSSVHILTAVVLHGQKSETPVGEALQAREWSLGVKAGIRFFIDITLLGLVAFDHHPFNPEVRFVVYIAMVLSSGVALGLGARYVYALYEENWGRPQSRD